MSFINTLLSGQLCQQRFYNNSSLIILLFHDYYNRMIQTQTLCIQLFPFCALRLSASTCEEIPSQCYATVSFLKLLVLQCQNHPRFKFLYTVDSTNNLGCIFQRMYIIYVCIYIHMFLLTPSYW